ncbi:glycosyltransferase [Candidatus Dojkabacteria bacterium]|nr:glycosyltransferase [Candidatus Dojkabacteria bacterium]
MLSWLKNRKKILQLLPSFAEHDAVSNQAVLMNDVFRENGYKPQIYSNYFPKKYKGIIGEPKFLRDRDFDVAIYHHSIGDPMVELVKTLNIPVILYYHNITPADYFEVYNQRVYELLMQGKKQLLQLKDHVDLGMASSGYNAEELEELGYENTEVLPIFFNPDKLDEIREDRKIKQFLDNEHITNLLFVGRFAPNKAHKDLIKAFYIYYKYYNSMSRLSLVGSYVEMNSYLSEITELIEALELESVVHVPGLVEDEEWKAFYLNSDIFISASEHEGFFVPALEANYFGLPIIAYDAGAVKSTLGGSGLIYENKKPEVIAELIHQVLSDKKLNRKLVNLGRKNCRRFEVRKHKNKLIDIVDEFLK